MTVVYSGSTSGTTTVQASPIAGSTTLTLPAETGTLRSTVSSGTVLQVVNYQIGTHASGTTIIPNDTTIPQNTEGDQYMSLAITPRSATSALVINVVVNLAHSIGGVVMACLFQDSTANALAMMSNYQPTASAPVFLSFTHKMTSGTTSATTFKVRAGCQSAGTTNFNSSSGMFGGVLASSITITEVVP